MDTLQWITKLINFDTVSSNSNLPCIKAIDFWLKSHGIETHIVHGSSELKANLLATIPAKNGQREGGLLLSGHTDVVPVIGQLWDTDPFQAIVKDNKVYGRGACDMKGFIAVILALIPSFISYNLTKPIHLGFTFDEEVGCIGVGYLVDYMKNLGIRPEGCIVGEPSNMLPIIGEKGRRIYHCQVKGLAAHSSLAYSACNAIEYASQLISYISNLANSLRESGPFDDDFDCNTSTISTNFISGGNAFNVVPENCEFIVELRYLSQFPHLNFKSQIDNYINTILVPQMRLNYSNADIHFDQISDSQPFNAHEDTLIMRAVRAVTGFKKRMKVSYSTEAGVFQDANIPTVICGPGSIAQAHKPNEFISTEQLILCEKVIQNVIYYFCTDLQKNNHKF